MTSEIIREALMLITSGGSLDGQQAAAAMRELMAGEVSPALAAALLTALRMKGETPEEIAGFARAMGEAALRVRPRRAPLVDTCGTGGGTVRTFNISTAAAFVVAGAAVAVAKHGNRGVTSSVGSADVLEALGVALEAAPEQLAARIDACGIGFLFAPAHHPALRHLGSVRRELPFRTVFNLIGPLANPAGTRRQVIGVFDAALTETLAAALRELGHERAMVVHGLDGLDELSTLGRTRVTELWDGQIRTYELAPEELGLHRSDAAALAPGDDAAASAAILERILAGEPGPRRDIVLLNAAAALVVAEAARDLKDGLRLGAESIDSAAAGRALDALR
jgi:anthranilate phosphoribosyltransferase